MDVVKIANGNELTDAIANGSTVIEIDGTISGIPSLTLPPGVNLRGGTLDFKAKGLRLTSDNEISELRVVTEVHEPAIFNDTSVADLGALSLVNVTTVGQVYLVAEDQVRAGRIVADNVNVECADVRGRFDRPHGFGVDALQGGFTIWNRQPDPAFTITARLTNISSGTNGSPVRGSGVFVGGHGNRDGHDNGGVLKVDLLSTDTIVTDGGIQRGTPDLISGGVFTISGSEVDEVVNLGRSPLSDRMTWFSTTGAKVGSWTAKAPITSRGPSGIGFVNFGDLGTLMVVAQIETFGLGARGFNVYDGSLDSATFESIATYAMVLSVFK